MMSGPQPHRRGCGETAPAVLVLQQGTFADAALGMKIVDQTSMPILWALREPSVKAETGCD